MAGPFTHLMLAHTCLSDDTVAGVRVHQYADYLLGSTFPDIIRVSLKDCQIPRHVTHPSFTHFFSQFVCGVQHRAPEQESFLLGYLVHLIVDKVWHNLAYCTLLETATDAVYQNPRLTFLVDRACWLTTESATRQTLASTIRQGMDQGVMEAVAAQANAERLAGQYHALLDWRDRLALAVCNGPEHLGLAIPNKEPVLKLSSESAVMDTIDRLQMLLREFVMEQLLQTIPFYYAMSNANGEDLAAETRQAMLIYDKRPLSFSSDALRDIREIICTLETL